jgi:hypothetical protein
MTTATICERVQAFKTSSSFSGGDPFSFSISLNKDLKLPGRHDPVDYLKKLDVSLKGKNVCVVCPGNAGLCVEALRAGAATVSAYELRPVYYKSLRAVASFAGEVLSKEIYIVDSLKPGTYDVVIWSEGVDDIRDPKLVFDSAILSVVPGGTFYLELAHGTAGAVPDRTNCWRPSKDGLAATIKAYPALKVVVEADGRNQTRKIYTIKDTRTPVAEDMIPQRAIEPSAPQPTIEILDSGPPDDTTDIEYFRNKLMSAVAKMREPADAKPQAAEDLSEVFDRPVGQPSTPKSKKRSGKESKS